MILQYGFDVVVRNYRYISPGTARICAEPYLNCVFWMFFETRGLGRAPAIVEGGKVRWLGKVT